MNFLILYTENHQQANKTQKSLVGFLLTAPELALFVSADSLSQQPQLRCPNHTAGSFSAGSDAVHAASPLIHELNTHPSPQWCLNV